MAIKCPWCLSDNTKIIGTRSKKTIEERNSYSINEVPLDTRIRDYVLRSHRCNNCYSTFMTCETYYKQDEILAYDKNS